MNLAGGRGVGALRHGAFPGLRQGSGTTDRTESR
jgi:hypothetical protein